jgi:hypothetical protein
MLDSPHEKVVDIESHLDVRKAADNFTANMATVVDDSNLWDWYTELLATAFEATQDLPNLCICLALTKSLSCFVRHFLGVR